MINLLILCWLVFFIKLSTSTLEQRVSCIPGSKLGTHPGRWNWLASLKGWDNRLLELNVSVVCAATVCWKANRSVNAAVVSVTLVPFERQGAVGAARWKSLHGVRVTEGANVGCGAHRGGRRHLWHVRAGAAGRCVGSVADGRGRGGAVDHGRGGADTQHAASPSPVHRRSSATVPR